MCLFKSLTCLTKVGLRKLPSPALPNNFSTFVSLSPIIIITPRYAKDLQDTTAMCEIFPIIIIYPQYAKISPQYAKISAQYTKISPQHAKINSTISSPLSSPLLKFNDGPILFLLLQRRLLLETLWTTAHCIVSQ